MKIANIIMVHKNPAQLERLIRAMDHECFHFFIHVDKKIDIQPFLYLSEFRRVTFIEDRKICRWGGYSFVKAILASLAEVLDSAISFDFYNLMSAQDYPIKPIDHIVNFYRENLGKSFISYDPDEKKDWWEHAIVRYEQYHFTDFEFRGKYFIQKVFNTVLPKRKFPLPIKLYGSSDSSWWSISNSCAKYLLDFMSINKNLSNFMKYTWTADEFLIASILMNSPHKNEIINNNLRYITWVNTSPNPLILTSTNLPEILNATNKLFARKFDAEVDSMILDELDKARK
ncbi:beta-1,6-N-acetylglucosaminyltransferase [Pedobacter cryotolerans]|uniref:Peptide O-xylosyltransferase n=1 Tax=Pedobacter cryotolerans TaxID=2571270 RepID=A0A4U1C3H4_9SPHI|nr:beta-1,6-N-acetylglucosaminyltransferase [Pedobacter cryotolerans]TKB99661.1 glycosyltransferase [Pedobacter cryotolerans]